MLVRFVPEEMTNAQYDKLDKDDQSLFLTVKFNYSNVGENKNLEIKGIKTYKFKEFTGKYLQLFPIWQKYFRQDADANNTMKDSKLQKLIDRSKNINYSFQEDNEGWILINQS